MGCEIDERAEVSGWRQFRKILPAAVLLLLAGCGKFFVPETSGGGGGTGTGNYLYVANTLVSTIAGFSVSTSGLAATPNSPYTLGVTPSAMAVTPSGSFLYVASLAGAIYGYSIGGTGGPTLLNDNNPVVSQISPVALKVDPTGNWLIAVDLTPTAYLFSINASTGLLTAEGNVPLGTGTPNRIVYTPNNGFVYVSLGTGGVVILKFNATTGVLTNTGQLLKPRATVNADQGLAVDPGSKYLFVAETGVNGVRVLSIGTTGAVTELSGSPYATGLGPSGVLVDSTGSYVYVANTTANNISAFLLSATGGLTQISGSPFATGTSPADLAEDISNTYLAVACAGGSPDLQLFSILTTTPGALKSFATATTGTDPTGAITVVALK